MIWGRTEEERRQGRLRVDYWFAWRPVQLIDGRWIWLTPVWRWYRYRNCAFNAARQYSLERPTFNPMTDYHSNYNFAGPADGHAPPPPPPPKSQVPPRS